MSRGGARPQGGAPAPASRFLVAHWSDLILLTFAVPEALVRSLIPPQVEPDRWQDRTHVSLVALRMRDLRLLGWRVPGFTAHPQVNFRTYIRYRGEPGVWFIRELVPSRLVATVARLVYREPFGAMPLAAAATELDDAVRATYRLGGRGRAARLAVTGSRATRLPAPNSPEGWFTARHFACRALQGGGLARFRVEHAPWAVRAVREVDYGVDWEGVYGADWRFLSDQAPVSTIFAVGSEVAVSRPERVSA
jgi:uncharacterized protein